MSLQCSYGWKVIDRGGAIHGSTHWWVQKQDVLLGGGALLAMGRCVTWKTVLLSPAFPFSVCSWLPRVEHLFLQHASLPPCFCLGACSPWTETVRQNKPLHIEVVGAGYFVPVMRKQQGPKHVVKQSLPKRKEGEGAEDPTSPSKVLLQWPESLLLNPSS